jgi:hypothetical protein
VELSCLEQTSAKPTSTVLIWGRPTCIQLGDYAAGARKAPVLPFLLYRRYHAQPVTGPPKNKAWSSHRFDWKHPQLAARQFSLDCSGIRFNCEAL